MSSASATILVVDDEALARALLQRVLVDSGYLVVTAVNGAEALRACERQHFDVVFTDIIMPEMDGFELIRALVKSDPAYNIVAVSGVEPMVDFLRMARGLGAKLTIRKPLAPEQVLKAVEQLLAGGASSPQIRP